MSNDLKDELERLRPLARRLLPYWPYVFAAIGVWAAQAWLSGWTVYAASFALYLAATLLTGYVQQRHARRGRMSA